MDLASPAVSGTSVYANGLRMGSQTVTKRHVALQNRTMDNVQKKNHVGEPYTIVTALKNELYVFRELKLRFERGT